MLPTNPLLNATTPAGPHLPVGLLRQYAAGTLAPAAQHRVEAHTLACPRCADILAGLQQTLPATTDQALAQLQQRLRQRVQQQAAPARYDREERRNRWLIPQLAAAAALLLGLVAGGWWAWQQRRAERTEATEVAAEIAPDLPKFTPSTSAAASSAAGPPAAGAPNVAPLPAAKPLAKVAPAPSSHRSSASRAAPYQGRKQLFTTTDTIAEAATVSAKPAPAAEPAAPLASAPAPTPVPTDSLGWAGNLAGRTPGLAMRKQVETYAVPPARMPAAPKVPPAPLGGYSALREKLRREATEFKPEAPEQPLSGTVQLRLTIGPDGKIQQTKVLRGLREDYDAEAQRLVCDGPGWIPGISGGKRAPLEIDIAVPF
jgi:outer membrane biosynthesis protein TonB